MKLHSYTARSHWMFLAACAIGSGVLGFFIFRHQLFGWQQAHPLSLWSWIVGLSASCGAGMAGGEITWRINKYIDAIPGRWDPFTGLLRRDKDGRPLDETHDNDKP